MSAEEEQSTAVVAKPRSQELRDYLNKDAIKEQIALALPKHMDVDKTIRVALTTINTTPMLAKCSMTTIFKCVLESSQLGLEINGALGHAYIVPFYNNKERRTDAQLIMGARGLRELAYRSKRVRDITTRLVFENETFTYRVENGKPILSHDPMVFATEEERGPLRGGYATAIMDNGEVHMEFMSVDEINEIRDAVFKSRRSSEPTGPWLEHYHEMCKKTLDRRICKVLPLSPEIVGAAVKDEYRELGVMKGDDMADVIDTTANEVPPTDIDSLAERLENEAQQEIEVPDEEEPEGKPKVAKKGKKKAEGQCQGEDCEATENIGPEGLCSACQSKVDNG